MPHAVARHAQVAALYAEHAERIHRFLRDLLGDVTLAADATQETFVRVLRKLPELEPTPSSGGNLAPWLFGIARNVSLELRKARGRAARYVAPMPCDFDTAAAGSPETDYLGREALRIVNGALEELSEERRAMLLLRLDHGLSYDDIAVSMGISLAKVKVEIFRARQVLREVMGRHESEGRGSVRRAR